MKYLQYTVQLMIAIICFGCAPALSYSKTCNGWISAGAEVEIRNITISWGGWGCSFGQLQGGAHGAYQLVSISFSDNVTIEYQESGVDKSIDIDLSEYADKICEIRELSFHYLGNNSWRISGYAGYGPHSATVFERVYE